MNNAAQRNVKQVLNKVERASEEHLVSTLRSLFSERDILTRQRKATQIQSTKSGKFLELDAWIPELKLGFEYQDPHHYVTTFYSFGSKETWKSRDEEKQSIMEERGDTLITVPCWWDGDMESLRATIHKKRKDLFPIEKIISSPIPDEAPAGFFNVPKVPQIGEVMRAVFVSSSTFASVNWWLGEKYDGVRACSVPSKSSSTLYSYNGKDFQLRAPFAAKIPRMFLDGEIWFGRGRYMDAAKFSLRNPESPPKWANLRFVVFDCPDPASQSLPFESRFASLVSGVPRKHSFINIAVNARCVSRKHMLHSVRSIVEAGGEGVVLREPESLYVPGRSDSYSKFKVFKDHEALVVAVDEDETFKIQLPNGKELDAVLSNSYEGRRPKKGDVVTFAISHFAKTHRPKQPRIFRIRWELSWKEVLDNALSYIPRKVTYNETAQRALRVSHHHTHGHWRMDDNKNMRQFFDDLAASKGHDPLNAEQWYSISRTTVLNTKGGSTILSYYHGSLVRALQDQYPNIGLEAHRFSKCPQSYWDQLSNRRKFLNLFARKMKFDPLMHDNWYSYSYRHIINEKGGLSLVGRYNGSYSKMVIDIYPDVEFNEQRFIKLPKSYWEDKAKRKMYFDSYAATRGFDPLVMDHWYKVHVNAFKKSRSGSSILSFYGDSLQEALQDIYPNSGFDVEQYERKPNKYWRNPVNARKFFDDYAAKNHFDPLLPEKWYSVSFRSIMQERSGVYVIGVYQGSLSKALMTLYPNIGLTLKGFRRYPKSYWDHEINRKEFFTQYAKKMGFDPLDASNWYSVTGDDIQKEKGGVGLLSLYSRSLSKALLDLFPNIGIDTSLFNFRPQNYWQEKGNMRKFFDSIARTKRFNPLVPNNWYQLSDKSVLRYKGGFSIAGKYEGSFSDALIDMYPEVKFDKSKFLFKKALPMHPADK
eukprot:Phypoly_transcript_01932.p1 GENE.Phypoly_transcript_01932~~Phypoly_transcript_01932.p1  ORF type:complete len:927 (+),score=132.48 Phypoly_transcript_01932:220-3000(+)